MIWLRFVVLVLVLAVNAGCTSGGGGSSSGPIVPWEKFRQDLGNTGQGIAGVIKNPGGVPTPVEILWETNIDNSPISASPAIGVNSQLFIGSEGGTLAALNLSNGSSAWPSNVTSCSACSCPTGAPGNGLGRLVSSPAVFTSNNETNVMLASAEFRSGEQVIAGSVYGFQFSGNNEPTCVFCFQPTCRTPTPTPGGSTATSTLGSISFVSSPSFTINAVTSNIAGIFIGATVTDRNDNRSGRLYALNADGSVKWVFPSPTPDDAAPIPTPGPGTPAPTAAPTVAPITSSPAIGVGNTVYFTTDDGVLYALTPNGDFLWKTELASGSTLPLAPSPVSTTTSVIASSANGVILALNTNGSFYWGLDAPTEDPAFANSLAVGIPANTPTPTPGAATPTPATPTLTPVAGTTLETVIAVHTSGHVAMIDSATGIPIPLPNATPIAGPVVSSPALSSDGYIIVGDHDGVLHAISTIDGSEPTPWKFPISLQPTPGATPKPIRSSPAIDGNGVIYVGSDDGYVYAVGTK